MAQPRYATFFTGASLVASILVALAVWPRDSVTFPSMGLGARDPRVELVARYTIDDFVTRMR